MARYFYYNENGEKIETFSEPAIKALAKAGLINPDTLIEVEIKDKNEIFGIFGGVMENFGIFTNTVQCRACDVAGVEFGNSGIKTNVGNNLDEISRLHKKGGAILMARFWYYDEHGNKQGAFTVEQIRGFARQGIVAPKTILEAESGKTALAGQVKGLTFGTAMDNKTSTADALSGKPTGMNIQPHFRDIYFAARAGTAEDVNYWMKEKGINVNSRSGGWTPLHVAAGAGNVDTVTALLEAGANINAKNNGNRTPLDYAIQYNHTEVINLLHSAGGNHSDVVSVIDENDIGSVFSHSGGYTKINGRIRDGYSLPWGLKPGAVSIVMYERGIVIEQDISGWFTDHNVSVPLHDTTIRIQYDRWKRDPTFVEKIGTFVFKQAIFSFADEMDLTVNKFGINQAASKKCLCVGIRIDKKTGEWLQVETKAKDGKKFIKRHQEKNGEKSDGDGCRIIAVVLILGIIIIGTLSLLLS